MPKQRATALRTLRRPRLGLKQVRAIGIGAALVLCGTSSLQNAVANGDTRTITLHHSHRGETGTFTFKKDGRYDPEVLEQLNRFLRDWRNDKSTKMDPQLFDIVWEVYRETGGSSTIQVVSAYRSPETNAMLRARSSGVAKFSQHMLGKAMDFYIPGVNLAELRAAGLRLQRGGVGFYPTSGSPFVHMDTGSVRHWPRMTHDQLARVFPDGKTVHVPTDGKPLARYEEALAEVKARGSSPSVAVASEDSGKGVRKFFASLFGRKDQQEEEEGESAVATPPAPARMAAAETPAPSQREPAPLPVARPVDRAAAALITAQATMAPLPQRRPAELSARQPQMASLTAAPLPPVITRGPKPESVEAAVPAAALGYATVGDVDSRRSADARRPPAPAQLTAGPRPRERGGRSTAPLPFGRVFQAYSIVDTREMRPPEMRAIGGTLVSVPSEIPAGSFTREGLASPAPYHFSGSAVEPVPTRTFTPGVKLTQLR